MKKIKSGFVALIGRPNVGKSTLFNHFIGKKIAIISDKPQTTRNRILGVLTTEEAQVVFLDTPGFHKPRHRLGTYMVDLAERTLEEVDLILYVVDSSLSPGAGEEYIIEHLKRIKTPVVLVPNKIDLVRKNNLLPLISWFAGRGDYAGVVPISALTGENAGELLRLILEHLPEGPFYYPAEIVTDQPECFVAGEIVREKVLQLTREEIPHSVAVVIEDMKIRPNQVFYIAATIFIERTSQKGIMIGNNGKMLKEIGRRAREDLEVLFGNQVYLDLWVKVKKDWRDDLRALRELGYERAF